MGPTRRSFLATLVAVAGCTGEPENGDGSRRTPTSTATRRTTTDGEGGPLDLVRWTYEGTHGPIETLTLAPGAGGPAVYVGSAHSGERSTVDPTGPALAAVSLREGREQWRVPLPDPPLTAPMYGGDDGPARVYLQTGRRSLHGDGSLLHAIDPGDGEGVWTFDTDAKRFVYPLATSDEAVFVGRRDDLLGPEGEYVYALDAVDGDERWRVESGDAADDGHGIRRDRFVFATHRSVRALDQANGEERWRVSGGAPVDGPVFGSRSERLFLGQGDTVVGLGLDDGEERWRRAFDFTVSRVTRPREAMSTTVHVGDDDGRLLALSPLDGTTRWTYDVEVDGFYPGVGRTSESLFVDGAGVHCLDPVSGERRWAFTPDVEGAVRARVSTTVFALADRRVWALDPVGGDVRWEFTPDARIEGVVTAGDLAFVAAGGRVLALDGGRTR